MQLSILDPLARAKREAGDGWIAPAKIAAIAKEVSRQCDALDGIEDGLVSNYVACNRKFDAALTPNPLAAIRCAGGADTGDTCLSDAQLKTVNGLHGSTTLPLALAKGWTTFSGWGTGSESAMNWKSFPAKPTAASANAGMRAHPHREERRNVLEANLANYAKDLQQLSALLDASDPDLSAFGSGGKLIMKVNTTGPRQPRWVADYYDKVVQTMSPVRSASLCGSSPSAVSQRNIGRNRSRTPRCRCAVHRDARRLGGAGPGSGRYPGLDRHEQ